MTAAARHRRHANPFTVRGPIAVPDWQAMFGRRAPLALDIGCGAGRFTCDLAESRPDLDVIGFEIRGHLVAACAQQAEARGLRNVCALVANASSQVPTLLPPRSVALVAVNFPDPWYKKRHHKRRVVTEAWLAAMAPALRRGAAFHAMSDYEPIAAEMDAVLRAAPGWTPVAGAAPYLPTTSTGLTSEREIKHQQRGEPIYRLHFVYQALPESS